LQLLVEMGTWAQERRVILIAIGGNLAAADGTPSLELCRRSAAALDGVLGMRLRGLSAWYSTAPIPASDQPRYVNAVAHLVVEAGVPEPDPAQLLAAVQAIELCAGRVRGVVNAARTLDLDIIAMGEGGQAVRERPDPILPHKRAHERGFVLFPLRDVAPGWVHPVLRLGVAAMIAALPPQDVRLL
jgi:2-amino-4-hydroxy-6-hydroxymethyldihydropteridine diphosphokinase